MSTLATATRYRVVLPVGMLIAAVAWCSAAEGGTTAADTSVVIARDMVIDETFSYPEARHRALEEAMAEATRIYGLFVESSQGLFARDDEGGVAERYWTVIAGDAVGVVTDYAVVSEGAYEEQGRSWYRFTYRIRVERQAAAPGDPGYTVLVTLNRDTFVDRGDPDAQEEMIIEVEPTRDSYLTILFQREDSLWVLYPNPIAPSDLIPAHSTFEYPSSEFRRAGLRLRVSAPANRAESEETILVVATRDLHSFPCGRQFLGSDEMTSGGCSLRDLGRWRLSVPRDRRALGVYPYRIQRTF